MKHHGHRAQAAAHCTHPLLFVTGTLSGGGLRCNICYKFGNFCYTLCFRDSCAAPRVGEAWG